MDALNCQFDMQGRGPEKPVTVGDPFVLACDGPMAAPLGKSVQLLWPDENAKYTLHVLEVRESSPQHFKLLMTSYRPGEHKDLVLKITDGTTTVETPALQLQVASVLKQGEEPKPVPSVGPFVFSYPLWFWLTIAGSILFVLLTAFFFIYRKRQRQKMLQEMDQYMTMLPPFNQFSKDMRYFVRDLGLAKDESRFGELAKKLDEDFRLYLVRELRVPAHRYSDSDILKEMRRSHRMIYEQVRSDLRKVLSEMAHAKKDYSVIRHKDCEDLLHLVRAVAEKIQALKRLQNKSRSQRAGA